MISVTLILVIPDAKVGGVNFLYVKIILQDGTIDSRREKGLETPIRLMMTSRPILVTIKKMAAPTSIMHFLAFINIHTVQYRPYAL